MQGLPWERRLDGSIILHVHFSALFDAFPDAHAANSVGTDVVMSVDNKPDSPSPLKSRTVSMFSQKNLKFWFVWPQNIFPVFLYPFLVSFAQRKWQHFWIMLTYASSLHHRPLTCICACRQWFLEVLLNPCSDFHERIISVFNAMLYEGQKIIGALYWFSA